MWQYGLSVLLGTIGGAIVAIPIALYLIRQSSHTVSVRESYTTIAEMPPHVKEQFRRSIVSMRRSMNEMCDECESLVSDKGKKR